MKRRSVTQKIVQYYWRCNFMSKPAVYFEKGIMCKLHNMSLLLIGDLWFLAAILQIATQ